MTIHEGTSANTKRININVLSFIEESLVVNNVRLTLKEMRKWSGMEISSAEQSGGGETRAANGVPGWKHRDIAELPGWKVSISALHLERMERCVSVRLHTAQKYQKFPVKKPKGSPADFEKSCLWSQSSHSAPNSNHAGLQSSSSSNFSTTSDRFLNGNIEINVYLIFIVYLFFSSSAAFRSWVCLCALYEYSPLYKRSLNNCGVDHIVLFWKLLLFNYERHNLFTWAPKLLPLHGASASSVQWVTLEGRNIDCILSWKSFNTWVAVLLLSYET